MLEKPIIYVLDNEFIVRGDSTYVADFQNINQKKLNYKQVISIQTKDETSKYNYSISYIKGEKNVLGVRRRTFKRMERSKATEMPKLKEVIRYYLLKQWN